MGPLTGIIPGKRVHIREGEIVDVLDEVPGDLTLVRPPLEAPTLERQPGENRAKRRAAQRKRR